MALQNFIARSLPAISAAWLNAVDVLKFTVFNDATTKAAARTALELDPGQGIFGEFSYSGVDSGAANAAAVTLSGPITAYVRRTGSTINFVPIAVNTGAATLNVNGTGVAAIVDGSGAALTGGELSVPVIVTWTGTVWKIVASHGIVYKRLADETSLGIVPVNYSLPPYVVDRYATNTTQGTTNMADAIIAAMKVALTSAVNVSGIGDHAKIVFLRGTYAVTSDSVFTQAFAQTGLQRGVVVEGQGLASTVLKLITGGAPKYFYKNTVANTQNYIFMTFRDLMFTSDSVTNGNGFYFQQDQGWSFHRCWFLVFARLLEGNGNFNGSEHKFFHCKITEIADRVISWNNNQMLNIELHGCDVESITGHVFFAASGGGGDLRVFGGSYILDDSGGDKYLLYIDGQGQGANCNTFNFYGIRTELHATDNTKLVFKGTASTSANINFYDSNITVQGTAREIVNITAAHLTFNRCNLPTDMTYTIVTAGGGITYERHGEPGSIVFNECAETETLSSRITTGSFGYARARGVYKPEYQSGIGNKFRYALDFDLNWMNVGRAQNFAGLKTANGKISSAIWPTTGDGDANDWTVQLPANALIRNIYVYRPAGASGSTYTLNVGNGDKSLAYGNDGGGLGSNVEHIITVELTMATLIAAGTTNPNNQVRVWATPNVADPVAGGYFIVEYY